MCFFVHGSTSIYGYEEFLIAPLETKRRHKIPQTGISFSKLQGILRELEAPIHLQAADIDLLGILSGENIGRCTSMINAGVVHE